ncbi:unnamed protein product [Gordionus sp. m RMFG-2023]
MKINVLDLIEAVRGSKFIYDKFDESYKDSRKKSEFWINLDLQFGESGDFAKFIDEELSSLPQDHKDKKRYPKNDNGVMGDNFSTERIIGDGNCLFRCINKEVCDDECHYDFLRQQCILFMRSKDIVEQMEGFLGEPVDKYLERTRMAQNATYGTEVEIGVAKLLSNNYSNIDSTWHNSV